MELENKAGGTLFLVGTPIGNLGDITIRALETLKNVDLIAAEDTRQTRKLLNHYNIDKPLTSYYEHNKRQKGSQLVAELLQGKNVALTSDAGMPGISDPGADLVKECIEQEIRIEVIPGPSAVLTGLVASGLDTTGFVFAGFFPREKKEQKKLLDSLIQELRTIIFYESPYRLVNTLKVLEEYWGDRLCCVARELTKIYEEYRRGPLSEVRAGYQSKEVKGEITLIVEGYKPGDVPVPTWDEMKDHIKTLLDKGLSRKDAVRETAQSLNISRRELYSRVIKEK